MDSDRGYYSKLDYEHCLKLTKKYGTHFSPISSVAPVTKLPEYQPIRSEPFEYNPFPVLSYPPPKNLTYNPPAMHMVQRNMAKPMDSLFGAGWMPVNHWEINPNHDPTKPVGWN